MCECKFRQSGSQKSTLSQQIKNLSKQGVINYIHCTLFSKIMLNQLVQNLPHKLRPQPGFVFLQWQSVATSLFLLPQQVTFFRSLDISKCIWRNLVIPVTSLGVLSMSSAYVLSFRSMVLVIWFGAVASVRVRHS